MEFIKSFLAGVYIQLLAMWVVLQCRVWSAYRTALAKLAVAMKSRGTSADPVSQIIASKLPTVEAELARVDAHMVENGCRGSSGGGETP